MAVKLLPLSALTYIKNNYCSNYYQVLNAPLTLETSGWAEVEIFKQNGGDDRECKVAFFHGTNQNATLGCPRKGARLSIWYGSTGWQEIQIGTTRSASAKQVAEILGGELEA